MPDAILSFFAENTPPMRTILLGGPPGFLWSLACLGFAGWLKQRRGWRTGYTRKVFHFLIFGSVAFLRHPYRVPSLTSVKATRSWEGSAAVLAMCLVAIGLAVLLSPDLHPGPWGLLTLPALAVLCAATEALSPHGWDNLTMQLVPTALAGVML